MKDKFLISLDSLFSFALYLDLKALVTINTSFACIFTIVDRLIRASFYINRLKTQQLTWWVLENLFIRAQSSKYVPGANVFITRRVGVPE